MLKLGNKVKQEHKESKNQSKNFLQQGAQTMQRNEGTHEKANENVEQMMKVIPQRFDQSMAIKEEEKDDVDEAQAAKRGLDTVLAQLSDADGSDGEPGKKKVKT